MNDQVPSRSIRDLSTPCLVLDEAQFYRNMARLQAVAEARGVAFRPHLKTAKSRHIAKICAERFGERAMVSTLLEIEQLRGLGLTDFLYSVAIVPGKFERIRALLADDCKVAVAVDSEAVARDLVAFCEGADFRIPAVIELDLDGHRSGVRPDDAEALCAIGRALNEGGLLLGVMAHAGQSYELSDEASLASCAQGEADSTTLAARTLEAAGLPCELVSIGSTPTALSGASYPGVTELRAGVFVFFDLVQAGIGVCSKEEIAMSVLASVISQNESSGALIIDAGWMALSRDRGTADQAEDLGYGQVCLEDGTILEDIIVADVQQEHGIVKPRKGSSRALPDLAPGTLLRILPNHACATASQHDRYWVLGEQGQVSAEWPRFSGW
ncbi:MAG: D-serine deaminase-like pyridoxal phosphate-dependent protein [Bacteroidia bacterium]|jgi:D-serine deaminase-like pyridoxal phosphate-dependent protein